ncbi:uncharacterized protein LOC114437849 [Parambassis ranga]|uniref:Uncharacterized protein LOC114437849 n=1 Tax=Parambassis ranga TaxID=210632 RepID=A0A6P7IG60_9TELE|nr:uncharacterized protein LOC114437849 [Parambassis ranga]
MTLHLCLLLILAALTGICSITTVREVSVRRGGSVSVPCLYEPKYKSYVKYLCEGYHWNQCTSVVKTNQAGEKFFIRDDSQQNIFTVTIIDVKSSYYWCAVEINQGDDVGSYFKLSLTTGSPLLYVDHQEVTGFKGEDLTITCRHRMSGKEEWCRLGGSCVRAPGGSIDGINVIIESAASVFTVTMRRMNTESGGWYFCQRAGLQMPVYVRVKHRPSPAIVNMTLHLCLLLILAALTGICSITTVRKVSVRRGGSVSVPCLYEPKYKSHVKYLCEGYRWNLCTYVVKTNQPGEKFFIRDDSQQNIFTVTIIDVKYSYYWCAVEINQGADVRSYFKLSLTTGPPLLYVDHQEVTGFNGEDLTITCRHRMSGKDEWCRLGGSCVRAPGGSIDGINVIIESAASVFTVTMRRMNTESGGWYFCQRAGLQMPVYVRVKHRPSPATTRKFITFASTAEAVNLTSDSQPPPTDQSGHHSPSVNLLSFIFLLTVAISILVMVLLIWFILKTCSK